MNLLDLASLAANEMVIGKLQVVYSHRTATKRKIKKRWKLEETAHDDVLESLA